MEFKEPVDTGIWREEHTNFGGHANKIINQTKFVHNELLAHLYYKSNGFFFKFHHDASYILRVKAIHSTLRDSF